MVSAACRLSSAFTASDGSPGPPSPDWTPWPPSPVPPRHTILALRTIVVSGRAALLKTASPDRQERITDRVTELLAELEAAVIRDGANPRSSPVWNKLAARSGISTGSSLVATVQTLGAAGLGCLTAL